MDPISSEPIEGRVGDMFSLIVGFATWIHKRAANAQGETTPGLEASGGQRSKLSGPNEEA